jgi:hypothetical protein
MLFSVALTAGAWAWDFRGHRVVAAVASDFLAPATREWVEFCLNEHLDPRARTLDGASVWPDLVRSERPETSPWHFINFPVGEGPAPPDRHQVIWAIEHVREQAACRGQGSGRAEALAFLVHLVGDVHQPLHACSFFGAAFPEGDWGGKRVLLSHSWAKNLHQFWDAAGEPGHVTVEELKTRVARSAGGPDAHRVDPRAWALESYSLAQQSAYPGGLPPGPELSEEYQQKARDLCAQRLFLAGLRLAYVLEKLGPEGQRALP